MGRFFRRQTQYFLIGFIVVFIVYLFIRYDADDIILGVVISAVGGGVSAVGFSWLGRRFPDEPSDRR